MLTTLVLQAYHRRFLQPVPALLALSKDQGMDILVPFLQWAEEKCLPMDWTTPLHLLDWLYEQPDWRAHITPRIVKQLLTVAAARWALSGLDSVNELSKTFTSRHLPGVTVMVTKGRDIHQAAKVVVQRSDQ